jgi:hypothetical protein
MRGFRDGKPHRKDYFLRFIYGLLLVSTAVLAFTLIPMSAAAAGEVVGQKTFQYGGESIPVTIFYIKNKDKSTYAVTVPNQFICESTVAVSPVVSQPPLIFSNCSNGWDFSLGEWNNRVISRHRGSRVQEVIADDSLLAWWCRTIIGHQQRIN